MFMFPLRTCMAELLWGRADAPAKEKQHYYLLTYGTLSALLVLAVLVPNIWAALSFVGRWRGGGATGAGLVPSVWAVLSFVCGCLELGGGALRRAALSWPAWLTPSPLSAAGNVASTLGAFIIPALISLSLGDKLLPSDASGFAKAANKVGGSCSLAAGRVPAACRHRRPAVRICRH
jgi:hypothetical protein